MSLPNRELGDMPLQVGDVTYLLRTGTSAMVALEDTFSTPQKSVTFFEVLEQINRGSIRHIRAAVWALLSFHHPAMTQTDAGRVIDQVGLEAIGAQLQKAMAGATPDPADIAAVAGPSTGKRRPARGATARGGTGAASTARHAASA